METSHTRPRILALVLLAMLIASFIVTPSSASAAGTPPNIPVVPTLTPTGSGNPYTASVRVTDPNGGQVRAKFLVKLNGVVAFDTYSPYVTSGSVASLKLPGLVDGNWTVEARASDGALESPLSAPKSFTVSTETAATESVMVPVEPFRLADTTVGIGGPAAAYGTNETRTYQVAGIGGIPASGVTGVVLDIASTSTTAAPGVVSVTPAGRHDPTHPTLRITASKSRVSGTAISKVSASGKIDVFNLIGPTNLNIDVQGYLKSTGASADGNFQKTFPTRVLDTQDGLGAPQQQLGPGGSLTVDLAADERVPDSATAVWVKFDVTSPTSAGTLFINSGAGWADPTKKAQTIDYMSGSTSSSAALVKLGANRTFRVLNSDPGSSVHLSAVVEGYIEPASETASTYHAVDPLTLLESATIPAGGSISVDSPYASVDADRYVSGLMVGVTVTGWSANGAVQMGNPELTDDPPSLVEFSGTDPVARAIGFTSLAVAPVASDGTLSLQNTSSGPINVKVSSRGWFTAPLRAGGISVGPDGWIEYEPQAGATGETVRIQGTRDEDGDCLFEGEMDEPTDAENTTYSEEIGFNPATCQSDLLETELPGDTEGVSVMSSFDDEELAEPDYAVDTESEDNADEGVGIMATSYSRYVKTSWIDPIFITITSQTVALKWSNSTWSKFGVGRYSYQGCVPTRYGRPCLDRTYKVTTSRDITPLSNGWKANGKVHFRNTTFAKYVFGVLGPTGWAVCGFPRGTQADFYHSNTVTGYKSGAWGYKWNDSKKGACTNLVHHKKWSKAQYPL